MITYYSTKPETTSNRNHGRQADLTQSLYQKTLAPFYYHPQSAEFAERFYTSVVTLNSLNTELKEKRLKDMIKQYPDNPFVEDLEYENKTSLTPADITRLQALLKTDISSGTKKYLLANYYQKNGNTELAKNYINRIDIDSCDSDCRPLMIVASPENRFWFIASDILSKHTIHNSHGDFYIPDRPFPISTIRTKTEEANDMFIWIIFALGVIFLCTGIKSERSEQK